MYNIIIFGTGSGSSKLLKDLRKSINIVAFSDNNIEKIGGTIYNKPIISPDSIKEYKYDYIIIASLYYKEITEQLTKYGIDPKKILQYFKDCSYDEYVENFDVFISFTAKVKQYIFKIKRYIYIKYDKQWFNPRYFSIFINPYYLIRKGLYKNIKDFSIFMNGRMIDFGCGKKPYKELFFVDDYIGIDIEKSGHNHSDEQIDIYYDGRNIPLSDESIDCIFTSEVFEHVFNLNEILIEINRVLKKNGKILITVPFVWNEHEMPYDFARYTSIGIKYLLESNGFKIIKQKKTNNFIESIFQMWNAYIYELFPKNIFINILLTVIFIFPSNIIAIILSRLLPKDFSFYNNNVILAEKKDNISKHKN